MRVGDAGRGWGGHGKSWLQKKLVRPVASAKRS